MKDMSATTPCNISDDTATGTAIVSCEQYEAATLDALLQRNSKKAANKAAALDNEQLGRLHMILSPFMLRRIKKDVESELLDRVFRVRGNS